MIWFVNACRNEQIHASLVLCSKFYILLSYPDLYDVIDVLNRKINVGIIH